MESATVQRNTGSTVKRDQARGRHKETKRPLTSSLSGKKEHYMYARSRNPRFIQYHGVRSLLRIHGTSWPFMRAFLRSMRKIAKR
jgi:hypothetical protein